MADKGITKNQMISELVRSPHGKLSEYLKVGQLAASTEPEFFAHLISWDRLNGQIRDSKVALPIVSLSIPAFDDDELVDNSFAHLVKLGPRELLRAYRFALEIKLPGRMRAIRRLIEMWLRMEEMTPSGWDRLALQHRHTLKELYALCHLKPGPRANDILFAGKYPEGSVFETVAQLHKMSAAEAASAIVGRKLPFLIAKGALGAKAKEPELLRALIAAMSPTELVTNAKHLEKMGLKNNPALRGEFEKALEKASKSKKNTLKTTKAVESVQDAALKSKLQGLQDRQISNLKGVEGNWLVLADKSGSMTQAIDLAKHVAGSLAKMVKGKVWLVFFDTQPMTVDVTGLPLDDIMKATKHFKANGGTSIGCGLRRMLDAKEEIDGIAIVSDGAEHQAPHFVREYEAYSKFAGKEVPVYFYQTLGESPSLIGDCSRAGIALETFDLRQQEIDYYSIPNLVATMRTNRYSLIDEVMATPLLGLSGVFKSVRKEVTANA